MAFGGPNSTATPLPVQDFTPTKNYPAFSGPISQYYNPVTYSNAANNVLLVSDVMGGIITHTTAGAQTDTLPSAALLVPAIEGGQATLPGLAPPTVQAGSGIKFFVVAGGAGTITIAVGTGGTLVGTASIAAGQIKEFLLVITALSSLQGTPSYTLYSLGTSTQ